MSPASCKALGLLIHNHPLRAWKPVMGSQPQGALHVTVHRYSGVMQIMQSILREHRENHKARHHRRGEGIKSPTDSSIGPAKIKGVWTSRRGSRHTRQTVCGWERVETAAFCCSTQGSSDEALCFLLETSSSLQFGAGDQIIYHLGSCWHLLEQL